VILFKSPTSKLEGGIFHSTEGSFNLNELCHAVLLNSDSSIAFKLMSPSSKINLNPDLL
jgi:hypothetical protein